MYMITELYEIFHHIKFRLITPIAPAPFHSNYVIRPLYIYASILDSVSVPAVPWHSLLLPCVFPCARLETSTDCDGACLQDSRDPGTGRNLHAPLRIITMVLIRNGTCRARRCRRQKHSRGLIRWMWWMILMRISL